MAPLRIQLPSLWDLLREVRTQVFDHLTLLEADLREATVMAASELVENAIEYGVPVPAQREAELEVSQSAGQLTVRVSTGIRSVAAAQTTIDQVATIRQSNDRQALYFTLLRQMAKSPTSASQLGLYRISGEGDFELSCLLENDVLHVTASRAI